MKKLLSVIVMVAMLVTAIVPAFATVAADATGVQFSVESTPFKKNASGLGVAEVTITVTNNPGFSALSIMAYYDNDSVAIESGDVTNTAFGGEDYVTLGSGKRSNLAAQKKLYEAAGLTDVPAANIYGAQIDVASDDADGLNTTKTGEVITLTVVTAKALDELGGKEFTTDLGFFIIEDNSSDENGDPLVDYTAPFTTTLMPDPFAPEVVDKTFDAFTIYAEDVNVYKGTTEVSVGIKYAGMDTTEDGINGTRYYFVYPKVEGLTLTSVTNGTIYSDSETFWEDIAVDPNAILAAGGEVNVDFEEISANAGYVWEGKDVLYVCVIASMDDPKANLKADGLVVSLNFTLDENVRVGTVYDIDVIVDTNGTVWAGTTAEGKPEFKVVPLAADAGSMTIISRGGECEHATTEEVVVTAPTCAANGTKNVVCTECGAVVEADIVIEATGHVGEEKVDSDATCTADGSKSTVCTVCGEVLATETIPATGHVDGEKEVVSAATCLAEGKWQIKCTVCGEVTAEGTTAVAGHTAGDKITTVAPTYEAEGAWEIRCTVCDTVLETGAVEKLTNAAFVLNNDAAVVTKPAKEIVLPIDVINNPGMFITRLQVKYDATKLAFVESVNGALFAGDNVYFSDDKNGTVTLYFESLDNADTTGVGRLADLYFTVINDEALVGETAVELVAEEVINYAGEDIFSTTNAAIAVTIEPNIVIGVYDDTVEVRQNLELPVKITLNPGIWATRLEVAYDANAFDFVELKTGKIGEANCSVKDGVITIFAGVNNTDNITGDGDLFTLVFTSKATGDYDFDVNVLWAMDVDGNEIDVKGEDATVTATPYAEVILGDVEVKAAENATVSVPVSTLNNKGLVALSMEVAYDAAALTFKGVTGGLLVADEFSASVKDGVITVYVESADVVDMADDGVLFYLDFAVTPTYEGVVALEAVIVDENTINDKGEELLYYVTNSTVTVVLHDCVADIDAYVAPTCTETGLTEGSHCRICGVTLVAQEVIDALGHTEVVDAYVAPTCTETGLTEGSHCSVCGEVFVAQEIIDALGHGETRKEFALAPTDVTEGRYDFYCTVCEEVIDTEAIPALGNYILRASALTDVISVDVTNYNIDVVAKVGAKSVMFAVKYGSAVMAIDSNDPACIVSHQNTFAYVTVDVNNADAKITVVDEYNQTKDFTITVVHADTVDLAFTKVSATEKIYSIDTVDKAIAIVSALNAEYVKFAVKFDANVTGIKAEGATAAVNYAGGFAYITVEKGAENVTLVNTDDLGNVTTYTVDVTFSEFTALDDAIIKASKTENLETIALDNDNNVISGTTFANVDYAKFAIGYTSDIVKVEVANADSYVYIKGAWAYVTVSPDAADVTITLYDDMGNAVTYTVDITFRAPEEGPEITKASAYKNAATAAFDAEANTITVTRRDAAKDVIFAVKYEDTMKTIVGDNCTVAVNAGFSYITLAAGETTATITMTDAIGNISVYTINIVD